MFKILVLLSGYPCARTPWGTSQNHGTPELSSFESFYAGSKYLKNILRSYAVDYICTTWDDVGEEIIRQTYKPIAYKSYSQEQFRIKVDEVLHSYEIKRMERRTEYYYKLGLENELVVSSIRFASQLQSRCDAAKLALAHMQKTSNSYDAILLTRYDISSRGGFLVRHPTLMGKGDFNFLKSSKNEPKFILPAFGQLNCGFPDMWFYMNLAGLQHYSEIAENYVSDITSRSSEYFEMMTMGWPLSRKFPMHSIYDFRQYSNEILKTNSDPVLMLYPEWEVSNLHSYHKYYLYLTSRLRINSILKFKKKLDVISAFLIGSSFINNIGPLMFELLMYLKISLKIFVSKLTARE